MRVKGEPVTMDRDRQPSTKTWFPGCFGTVFGGAPGVFPPVPPVNSHEAPLAWLLWP